VADHRRAVGRVPEAVGLTPPFHTWQPLVEGCRQAHLLPGIKKLQLLIYKDVVHDLKIRQPGVLFEDDENEISHIKSRICITTSKFQFILHKVDI
jgi:hypothetical protein